jgi:Mor family transcriptional regulator
VGLKVTPDVVQQLVEVGIRHLTSAAKLEEGQARDVMDEIANDFFRLYEGQNMYMAKNVSFLRSKRDDAIWDAYNGLNHTELAAQHNITVIHLYRIIERKRQEARRKNQPLLPGFDDASLAD